MSTLWVVFAYTVAIIVAWTVHDIQAWCERHDYDKHRED